MRNDLDATIAEVVDGDGVAEVTGKTLNLDALLEKRGESGWVEDAVLGWLGCVDDVLHISCQKDRMCEGCERSFGKPSE